MKAMILIRAVRAMRAMRALGAARAARAVPAVLLVLLSAAAAHGAQLYRWVDSKGNVEWRDTPPPASVPAKNIQERRIGDNVVNKAGGGSFAMQQAAKNHPITLWTGRTCGQACDAARNYLTRRGVPFKELTPQDDIEGFNAASPKQEVPVLIVGKLKATGYLKSEWDNLLDAGGYPATATGGIKPPAAAAPSAASPGGTPAPAPPAGFGGPAPQGGPPSPGAAAPAPQQPPAGGPEQPR